MNFIMIIVKRYALIDYMKMGMRPVKTAVFDDDQPIEITSTPIWSPVRDVFSTKYNESIIHYVEWLCISKINSLKCIALKDVNNYHFSLSSFNEILCEFNTIIRPDFDFDFKYVDQSIFMP